MDTRSGHDPGTGTGGGTPARGDGSPSPPTPPVAGGAWAPPREPTSRSLVTARITAVAAWVLLGAPSAVLVYFLLLAFTFVQGLFAPGGTEDVAAWIESRIAVVALLGLAAAVVATVRTFLTSSARVAWRWTAVAGVALASPMLVYAVLALTGPT